MKELAKAKMTKGAGTKGLASIPLWFLESKGKWLNAITILARSTVNLRKHTNMHTCIHMC